MCCFQDQEKSDAWEKEVKSVVIDMKTSVFSELYVYNTNRYVVVSLHDVMLCSINMKSF